MRPTYRWSCHPRQGQIINALGSEGWTMLMEDALEKLAEGQFPHIYLGSIGPQVARALGAKGTDEVLLLQYSYSHIRFEHKELRKEQMMILPDLLKNGIVIQHKKHKNKAAIFYQDPTGSDRYFAAIKATCSGNAIYCDTFRRAQGTQHQVQIEKWNSLEAAQVGWGTLARRVPHPRLAWVGPVRTPTPPRLALAVGLRLTEFYRVAHARHENVNRQSGSYQQNCAQAFGMASTPVHSLAPDASPLSVIRSR